MYLRKIILDKIRCFKDFEIEFDLSGKKPAVNVIVGDNATGKTALLRSIAIGMCDESSAAGLMRESEEGYIRRGEKHAKIIIELIGEDLSVKIIPVKFIVLKQILRKFLSVMSPMNKSVKQLTLIKISLGIVFLSALMELVEALQEHVIL